MDEIATAEKKFETFREEMSAFRGDLKEYYSFFVGQCENIINTIQDNQIFVNSEYTVLRSRLNLQDLTI